MISKFRTGFLRDSQAQIHDRILNDVSERCKLLALEKLMYISFLSNGYSHTHGSHHEIGWQHLELHEQNVSNAIFPHPPQSVRIFIWFMPPNVDVFRTNCIPFFVRAIQERKPDRRAYTDDNNKSILWFDGGKSLWKSRLNLRKRTRNPHVPEEPQNRDNASQKYSVMPDASRSRSIYDPPISEENSNDELDIDSEPINRTYHSESEEGEIRKKRYARSGCYSGLTSSIIAFDWLSSIPTSRLI